MHSLDQLRAADEGILLGGGGGGAGGGAEEEGERRDRKWGRGRSKGRRKGQRRKNIFLQVAGMHAHTYSSQ